MLRNFTHILCILLSIFLCSKAAKANDNFITEKIHELVEKNISDKSTMIELVYNSSSNIEAIIKKQDEVKLITLEKVDVSISSFVALVKFNDNSEKRVSGRFKSFFMVPQAARHLKIGSLIRDSDINLVKTSADVIKKGYIVKSEEIIGMQTRGYISPGKMFLKTQLARPNIIKNKDPVSIIYNSGTIHLKTTGIALGNAALGDNIRARNSSTGSIISGVVIGKNTIKVNTGNE